MSDRAWSSLLAARAAAAIIVVVLALRVRSLTDEVRHLRFESNLPQVGDVALSLRRPLLDGDSIDLARPAQGRRQVWFVFDTRCPICRASLAGWKAALRAAGGR